MTLAEIFGKLFPIPYRHGKWLNDQNILIGRMRAANTEFFNEQADKLQKFQDANQVSIVMIDILVDRVRKHLTTEGESVINTEQCDSMTLDDRCLDSGAMPDTSTNGGETVSTGTEEQVEKAL